MDFGDKSLSTVSVDTGFSSLFSCCFLNASMNGVRVRIAVSSEYTPSVERLTAAEKHLVWFEFCLSGRETTDRIVGSRARRAIATTETRWWKIGSST